MGRFKDFSRLCGGYSGMRSIEPENQGQEVMRNVVKRKGRNRELYLLFSISISKIKTNCALSIVKKGGLRSIIGCKSRLDMESFTIFRCWQF